MPFAQAGDTALHLASFNNHPQVVQLLLDKGANINQANEVGRVMVHFLMGQVK